PQQRCGWGTRIGNRVPRVDRHGDQLWAGGRCPLGAQRRLRLRRQFNRPQATDYGPTPQNSTPFVKARTTPKRLLWGGQGPPWALSQKSLLLPSQRPQK